MRELALIPCRAGSKRLPGKNSRVLGGRVLTDWTAEAAKGAGLEWYVCTDDAKVMYLYSPEHVVKRDPVPDDQPDITWVTEAIEEIRHRDHENYSVCAPCSLNQDHLSDALVYILRPTSPFRDATTIEKARQKFLELEPDSLRAVRKATEPAWKQWLDADDGFMVPVSEVSADYHLHSRPTQVLRTCFIQTAGLEITTVEQITRSGTIAGERVAMFELEGPAALDINDEHDWAEAERIVEEAERERTGNLAS